jgi:hypothetical protein
MQDLSTQSKTYIFATLGTGGFVLVNQLTRLQGDRVWLVVLALAAALAQAFKVHGPTPRSNYNVAWLLYGFSLFTLGLQAALFVILIAHLAEWLRHRYPWYIQTFNIAVYALAALVADWIHQLINPTGDPLGLSGALAVLVAIATFTFLNHLLVGIVLRLARDQSFAESGVFDFLTLATDFTLLGLGAASALIFLINPFGALLNVIPVYLLYQALKVPALGRRVQNLEARLAALDGEAAGPSASVTALMSN